MRRELPRYALVSLPEEHSLGCITLEMVENAVRIYGAVVIAREFEPVPWWTITEEPAQSNPRRDMGGD
jgi:hypothetical protein